MDLSVVGQILQSIAIIAVTGGWLYTNYRNRSLQRRRIAVEIVKEHLSHEKDCDAFQVIFRYFQDKPEYKF